LPKSRLGTSGRGFLCPVLSFLTESGAFCRVSGRDMAKTLKLKKFYCLEKTTLYFKTLIFNFEARKRGKKIFALWKIYILLTKETSQKNVGPHFTHPFSPANPLLPIALRHLQNSQTSRSQRSKKCE
jgi:hypothetical protein